VPTPNLLLASRLGSGWPSQWHGDNEFAEQRYRFIIATIQALDMAQGRPARPLNDEQREWLAIWAGWSG